MDVMNYGQRLNTPPVEKTDLDTDVPDVNFDLFEHKVLADTANIHDAALVETVPYTSPEAGTEVEVAWVNKLVPGEAPVDEMGAYPVPAPVPAPAETEVAALVALLNREESEHFRTRWNEIQGKFVDEPRDAVQQADVLVSEVIGKITEMFTSEHGALESEWKQGNDVSTEDLRKALQRYRSFFNRLVV